MKKVYDDAEIKSPFEKEIYAKKVTEEKRR